MNRRVTAKKQKKAEQKVIAGQSLSPKERIAHNKAMENWFGMDIVKQIKQFGKV